MAWRVYGIWWPELLVCSGETCGKGCGVVNGSQGLHCSTGVGKGLAGRC